MSNTSRPSAYDVLRKTPKWEDWKMNATSATPSDSVMYRNQPALPNLPVPELATTLEKLSKSIKPLAKDSAELQAFERKVEVFSAPGGIGETLQKRLVQRREGTRNWIAEWYGNFIVGSGSD